LFNLGKGAANTEAEKAADPMPEDERKRLRLPNLFRPGTK
jgi:hypothetical protein